MATQASLDLVQTLYVAYYGRPADPSGQQYWAEQIDERGVDAVINFFGTSPEFDERFGSMTNEQLVNNLYYQLFGREAEQEGLDFYVGHLDAGNLTLAEIALTIATGAQNEDVDALNNKVAVAQAFTDALDDPNELLAYQGNDAANAMRNVLVDVDENTDPSAVDVDGIIEELVKEASPGTSSNLFTLTEATMSTDDVYVDVEPVTETRIYWGDAESGEGVPLEAALTPVLGVAVVNLLTNLINSPAGSVASTGLLTWLGSTLDQLQSGGPLSDLTGFNGEDLTFIEGDENTITVEGDGSVVITSDKEGDYTGNYEIFINLDSEDMTNAQVQLTQMQFDLLRDLLFDAEGNILLFEKDVTYQPQVALRDADGEIVLDINGDPIPVDLVEQLVQEGTETQVPIVLTPTQNNGGTLEQGYTIGSGPNGDSDLIVAGRLELLHQAYIDAGSGYDILEVDAKGTYAQPLALRNIEEVRVQNLNNVYTVQQGDGNTYPDLPDNNSGNSLRQSVLDLSRATEIEKLVVTEGDFQFPEGGQDIVGTGLGSLVINGIRNGAETVLDGSFTQPLTLNFSASQGDGLDIVLNNVSTEAGNSEAQPLLYLAHNATTLNLESTGGGNYLYNSYFGGQLTTLNITGDAHLYIARDLDASMLDQTPLSIDASENSGGVTLTLTDASEITFHGSQADDRVTLEADDRIVLEGNGGDNVYDVDADTVTMSVMDGNNELSIDADDVTVTAGDGNNMIDVDNAGFNGADSVVITTGNGDNQINTDDSDNVTITTGEGNDVISSVRGESVTIESAGGDNEITVSAEEMAITTGAGNDTIVVSGMGSSDIGGDANTTALVNIATGSGDDTVVLGRDLGFDSEFGLTALPGSSISGENVTLYVENPSDLRAAELDGISNVVLNYDITPSNAVVEPALTLTDAQFLAIGAENFDVEGAAFDNYSQLKIIVTEDTSLTDLGVDSLPPGVDLQLEIRNGVTLEMTAEQLHTKVAPNGVTLSDQGTDEVTGKVLITDAGLDFDPFNSNDQVRTTIDSKVYFGGSLSDDFHTSTDEFVGRDEWGYNVLLDRNMDGYDRPADEPSYSRLVIDTDSMDGDLGPFSTIETFLRIVGDSDLEFTPVEGAIDDWGRPIEGGTAIGLGVDNGNPTNEFMVDFSGATGDITNLAFSGFENAAAIYGNGSAERDVRLNVEISDDKSVASADAGLVSQGVQTYVVTNIGDLSASPESAEFWTSRVTQDLEVLGLQGNYDDTITFGNTERGVEFLMEVAYDKFDGYSVGTLNGLFARSGATAVINVVGLDELPAGEVQKVAGISLGNATDATVNIEGGNTVIKSLSNSTTAGAAGELETLTLDADGDLEIGGDLPATLEVIDASGVEGAFSGMIDGFQPAEIEAPFSFIGAQGGSTLVLEDLGQDDLGNPYAHSIDGGTAGVELIIQDEVDLSGSTLTNVTSVTLTDGSTLTLDMTQADDIGPANFLIEEGDSANLELMNLAEEPFALANYADGINVSLLGIAPLPEVTLHPDTDLTGIGELMVPEGTVLNLTAEQFQQLEGNSLSGVKISGDGTVNITDLTQADVADGFKLSQVTAERGTLTLAEDVELAAGDNLGEIGDNDPSTPEDLFEVLLADGQTLTLADVQQADGLQIGGVTDTTTDITLAFTDTTGFLQNIDASGFNVDELRITDLLVSGNNVDYIFQGLPEGVTKVIYNGAGDVAGRLQNVVVEEGTTIFGDVSFNEYLMSQEITHLTLNLEGGTRIEDDLVLSTVEVNDGGPEIELVPSYLQELIINSSGTGTNIINGETANVIGGDITPAAYGPAIGAGSRDNNLKTVTINADQNFVVMGEILFSSHGDEVDSGDGLNWKPDDGITANDDNAATATLTVTGDANTTIGDLDTDDDDIDALVVNHTGSGTLTFGLSSLGTVDAEDAITVNGSATGDTIINVSGTLDLSDDTLVNVNAIVLDESGGISGSSADVSLTLTQEQLNDIGAGNITVNEDSQTAYLNINAFDGAVAFDATALDPAIDDVDLFMAEGVQTLDPTTDLTGVDSITVPKGGTLNLTAAQFQQLQGDGSIVGDGSTDYTVNITDLTQADVDAGLDLTGITADNVTVTLAEDVDLAATDDLGNASVIIPDTLTLGLATAVQADGLVVDGGTDSTVVFQFDSTAGLPGGLFAQIDASGYDVTTLKALATFVGGLNAEYTIDDLPSSVVLQLFQDPEELGFLSPTNRIVFIEEDVDVPANGAGDALIFNDWDTTDEVRTLSVTMDGGVVVQGDISLPTRTNKDGDLIQRYFETLTLVSQGDEVNTIEGGIDTQPSIGFGPNTSENNLLDVVINATQDLVVTGELVFNHTSGTDTVANLTLIGDADVSIKALDTTDPGITGLVIDNLGTGTLTVTGGSDALELNDTESLVFSGTGDIVLDTDDGSGNNGIQGTELEEIDASGLSGDLTLGVIENIDSQDFLFTSGTGTTTLTLDNGGEGLDVLNASGPDDTGWTFNMASAGVGSELHIGNVTWTAGPLNIDLGANTTLYIDEDTDWTDLDLSITQGQPIVLADGVTLTLTAAQASGLDIVAGPDDGTYDGQVVIDDLGAYTDTNGNGSNDDPSELFDYDFSGIQVPASATLFDDDVTLSENTDLGNVSIGLKVDNNFNQNLAGQTIRFNTEEQADGRVINVIDGGVGYVDPSADGDFTNSTNVIWLFDSITDTLDTSGYDPEIGRVWFTQALANGANVEDLFSSLPNAILRVDFADLTELEQLLDSSAVNRTIELASFTELPDGLEFSDQDQLEHIESLTVKMGGEVTVGDILIGNIVNPEAGVNSGSITFDTLTIESWLADDTGDLLAREGYDDEVNVAPVGPNVVGDIGVGPNDNGNEFGLDLTTVNLDTGPVEGTQAPGDDNLTGTALVGGTITFDTESANDTATLDVDGDNDITFKALDLSDPDFTAFNLDVSGFALTANLTFTGGSPALEGGNGLETVNVDGVLEELNGQASTVRFGYIWEDANGDGDKQAEEFSIHRDGNGDAYAGIYAPELSTLDVSGTNHTVRFGHLADIDGSDDGGDDAFTLTGNGSDMSASPFTSAIIGEGVVDGTLTQPELEAGSTWRFVDAHITLTGSAILNPGSNLVFEGSTLVIQGDVDLSEVNLSIDTPIEVLADSSLTLTVEQVDALETAGFNVFGEGAVNVVGESDDTNLAVDTQFGNLNTATVDVSAVTLAASDGDQALNITANGAEDATGSDLEVEGNRIAQTIIGSANNDAVTVSADADDGDTSTIDVITRLGADSGDIGVPEIPSGQDGTEEGGDTIGNAFLSATGATVQVEADAGFDGIVELRTGDVIKVANGAEFYALTGTNFVASSETTNDGIAVVQQDSAINGDTLDLSAAGGPNGWTLIGTNDPAAITLIGSDQDDTLIDGVADDDDNDGEEDSFTGNAGADLFQFNIATSNPATFSAPTTVREARDYEGLKITYTDATDEASDEVNVNLDLDGSNIDVLINESLTPGVNFALASSIAGALVTALNGVNGITAQLDPADATGETVVAYGEDGQLLQFNSFTPTGAGMTDTGTDQLGGTVTNQARVDADYSDDSTDTLDDDIGEVSTTLSGAVTAGETYSMTITVGDGDSYTRSVTATTTNPQDVVDALAGAFNGIAGVEFEAVTANVASTGTVAPSSAPGAGEIIIVDQDADDGGATITATTATSAVTAVSASSILAGTETSLAEADADVITDFASGEDTISLGISDGSAGNYSEGAEVADFATALGDANTAMAGGDTYYLTSTAADEGLLFFDANADGEADGVVQLLGVDASTFAAADIVA